MELKHETLHYIFQYADNQSPTSAAEGITYLCSMLWQCRSDKLNQMHISFLVDITNCVLEENEAFSDLEKLPENDEKAFRLGHNDIYFKDFNHGTIKDAVQQKIEGILIPSEQKPVKNGFFQKFKSFFN